MRINFNLPELGAWQKWSYVTLPYIKMAAKKELRNHLITVSVFALSSVLFYLFTAPTMPIIEFYRQFLHYPALTISVTAGYSSMSEALVKSILTPLLSFEAFKFSIFITLIEISGYNLKNKVYSFFM